MNIYELNALIACLEAQDGSKAWHGKDLLPFYYKQREKLAFEINLEIGKVLKND